MFQILNMLILGSFGFTQQKILVGKRGSHAFWDPDVSVLENHVFAHFGAENFEIQKFFFLQISLFIGPIDGTDNNFLSGLPFWLYCDF